MEWLDSVDPFHETVEFQVYMAREAGRGWGFDMFMPVQCAAWPIMLPQQSAYFWPLFQFLYAAEVRLDSSRILERWHSACSFSSFCCCCRASREQS